MADRARAPALGHNWRMRVLRALYRALGHRYFVLFAAFEIFSAVLITIATVALFALYTTMSGRELAEVMAVALGCVTVSLALAIKRGAKVARPLVDWIRAGRPERDALRAWRTAVSLPREVIVDNSWRPFVLVSVPVATYYTLRFGLPFWATIVIALSALVSVAYAAVLHFLASEQFMRPVLEDVAGRLPSTLTGVPPGISLRWKLLGALPVMNVATGVVVAGLSSPTRGTLFQLGIDVLLAVAVAFTVSLELTWLISRSVLAQIEELMRAIARVAEGDLSARARVTSGDELGALAGSFNAMVQGLAERETLREALGTYLGTREIVERVVAEGEMLAGQELDATVLFCDISGFTAYAERATPRETVALLNRFYEAAIPEVNNHRGHANKLLGDGLLAVFGAPERLDDHADAALEAAIAIVGRVRERLPAGLGVGIGLNSGPVVVGSVGGGGRLDFTVIGDTVNVAARVERATRRTGDVILITEATRERLQRVTLPLISRGSLELRGKSQPVDVFAVALDQRAQLTEGAGAGERFRSV